MAVIDGRMTAIHRDALALFIIGFRINRALAVTKWFPVFMAMPPMLRELDRNKEIGLLATHTMLVGLRTVQLVQYWKDFDSLEAYARDRDQAHWPAWTAFNKAIGNSGVVGIYHETFVVAPGQVDTIYVNMPEYGMGKVAGVEPAIGNRSEARGRLSKA